MNTLAQWNLTLKDYMSGLYGPRWNEIPLCMGSVSDFRDDALRSRCFVSMASSASAAVWKLEGVGQDCVVHASVAGTTGGVRQNGMFLFGAVLMLDDIGRRVSAERVMEVLGKPTAALMTSPDNWQWYYRLAQYEMDPVRFVLMMKGAHALGLTDGAGRNAVRLGRVPWGVNGKAIYGDPPGLVELTAWNPEVELDALVVEMLVEAGRAAGGVEVLAPGATGRGAFSADVNAPDDILKMLFDLGKVKRQKMPGIVEIECPFVDGHSDPARDGSTYSGDSKFWCAHDSCAGRVGRHEEFRSAVEEEYRVRFGVAEGVNPRAELTFGHEPVALPPPEPGREVDGLLLAADMLRDGFENPGCVVYGRFVYVIATSLFVDRLTMSTYTADQFNALMSRNGGMLYGSKGKQSPAAMFLNLHGEKVASMTYLAGGSQVDVWEGQRVLNLWRPSDLVLPPVGSVGVNDPHVQLFLSNVSHIFGGHLDIIGFTLDFFAHVLLRPQIKINFGFLLCSLVEGLGKDLLFRYLVRAVGVRNSATVTPAQLVGNFNSDWIVNRLILINELSSLDKVHVSEVLKPLLAAPPFTLKVATKFQREWEIPNHHVVLATTNKLDALPIDKDTRRWFVFNSEAKPRDPGFYAAAYASVEGDGAARVARWLMDRGFGGFNPKLPPPDTLGHKAIMAGRSLPDAVQNVMEFFEDQFGDRRTVVASAEIVRRMDLVPGASILRQRLSPRLMGAALRQLGWSPVDGGANLVRSNKYGGRRFRLWRRNGNGHVLDIVGEWEKQCEHDFNS